MFTSITTVKVCLPQALLLTIQVHILKRAQILVAEIWGCFQGCGLGAFDDIGELTMFADYRFGIGLSALTDPQSSADLGAFWCACVCAEPSIPTAEWCVSIDAIDNQQAGEVWKESCREELEIRGCSIQAVEVWSALSPQSYGAADKRRSQAVTCPIPINVFLPSDVLN
jgi:hypothetical protein